MADYLLSVGQVRYALLPSNLLQTLILLHGAYHPSTHTSGSIFPRLWLDALHMAHSGVCALPTKQVGPHTWRPHDTERIHVCASRIAIVGFKHLRIRA